MTTSPSNSKRQAFAEAVSIEAWHKPFGSAQKIDLHVDVVFGIARIGGEADAPVRFRLSIRQAELVLVIPTTEPVGVDQASVTRDTPKNPRTKITKTIQNSSKSQHAAGGGIRVASKVSADLNLRFEEASTTAADEKVEITGEIEPFRITQAKTADGSYRWTMEPQGNDFLEGRPWDGSDQPRLKLIDKRKDRTKSMPPVVLLEIRCRREDLKIDDLELKDETAWEAAKAKLGFKNHLAAAESYIRDRLMEEGLFVNNISDIFGSMTLARVMAEPSP